MGTPRLFEKLVVIKGPFDETMTFNPGELVIPFEELARISRSLKVVKHFFRFKRVVLKAHRLDELSSPFFTSLVLKLISQRTALIEDDNNDQKTITWSFIFYGFIDYIREYLEGRRFLQDIRREVNGYAEVNTEKMLPPVSKSGQPVYLRTDVTQGLRAGGSIGHIAGVLNSMPYFSNPPIFLTSENFSAVNSHIECHVISPDNRFLSFPELKYLNYNRAFFGKSKVLLASREISFIYQRYSLNNYTGLYLSRHFNVPFVLEYNGSEVWVGKNWGKRVRNESLSISIEELNLKSAHLVVVVSAALKNELENRGVSTKKILVNPNGVDTDKYSPEIDGSAIKAKYGLLGKTVIGFIGTFGKWHGAEVLVDAFSILLRKYPEYRGKIALFYIGDGTMMSVVKERVENHKLTDGVVFTGVVPQEQGPVHLAACDILASPHIPNPDGTPFFGSPTKIFEYMAMGKGIVASNIGQLKEILEHKATAWMVRPADASDLMEGLKILIEDPRLRMKLGEKARNMAVDRHTWKMHTQKIFNALEELQVGDK